MQLEVTKEKTYRRQLDETDLLILRHLQQNARISNKELAALVGLAPSSCLVRVQRLIADGVIRSFHAEVDAKYLGVGIQAMISVRLGRHAKASVDGFRDQVLSLEEVIQLYHVAGSQDIMIHVAVRDPDHLRKLVLDHLSVREEVGHIETALIFDYQRAHMMPTYLGQRSSS